MQKKPDIKGRLGTSPRASSENLYQLKAKDLINGADKFPELMSTPENAALLAAAKQWVELQKAKKKEAALQAKQAQSSGSQEVERRSASSTHTPATSPTDASQSKGLETATSTHTLDTSPTDAPAKTLGAAPSSENSPLSASAASIDALTSPAPSPLTSPTDGAAKNLRASSPPRATTPAVALYSALQASKLSTPGAGALEKALEEAAHKISDRGDFATIIQPALESEYQWLLRDIEKKFINASDPRNFVESLKLDFRQWLAEAKHQNTLLERHKGAMGKQLLWATSLNDTLKTFASEVKAAQKGPRSGRAQVPELQKKQDDLVQTAAAYNAAALQFAILQGRLKAAAVLLDPRQNGANMLDVAAQKSKLTSALATKVAKLPK